MAEEKSVLVYGKSVDAQEKFDYFVATITGALVAYGLQSYEPQVWAVNAATLEPVALILLLLSFYFGMMRIQATVLVFRHNCDSLRAGENAGSIQDAINRGDAFGTEPGTGRVFSNEQFPAVYQMYRELEVGSNDERERHNAQGNTYYWWRNHLFIAGFVFLLLSKVLKPYWG